MKPRPRKIELSSAIANLGREVDGKVVRTTQTYTQVNV